MTPAWPKGAGPDRRHGRRPPARGRRGRAGAGAPQARLRQGRARKARAVPSGLSRSGPQRRRARSPRARRPTARDRRSKRERLRYRGGQLSWRPPERGRCRAPSRRSVPLRRADSWALRLYCQRRVCGESGQFINSSTIGSSGPDRFPFRPHQALGCVASNAARASGVASVWCRAVQSAKGMP